MEKNNETIIEDEIRRKISDELVEKLSKMTLPPGEIREKVYIEAISKGMDIN